jgi:hypothetical protein
MSALRSIRNQLRTIGVRGMASLALANRLGRRALIWPEVSSALAGARGVEIGGPSPLLRRGGPLPVYEVLASLDNCHFASDTMWHGSDADGSQFHWDDRKPPGTHLVRDGTDLAGIAAGDYDVVLSCHSLEHIANPLRALAEWARVVGPEGHVLLVVPHAENTIDRRRPTTTLAHIEDDFSRGTGEDDVTHLEEFIDLADFGLEPTGTTREAFRERKDEYVADRAVHHHVFDTRLVLALLDRAGYTIEAAGTALPFHILALARASADTERRNDAFLGRDAAWARHSVFRRDRLASR